jgi:hypothetical protein
MNPITTDHATIRTATVSVKVLTLDKKQMTLSVFRQLPLRHVIDPLTMELRGTPWGHVNYFWDDSPNDPDYHRLHIIWERSGRLYRSLVDEVELAECQFEIVFNGRRQPPTPGFGAYGDCVATNYLKSQSGWLIKDAKHKDRILPGKGAEQFADAWNSLHSRLAALDQLFIAV